MNCLNLHTFLSFLTHFFTLIITTSFDYYFHISHCIQDLFVVVTFLVLLWYRNTISMSYTISFYTRELWSTPNCIPHCSTPHYPTGMELLSLSALARSLSLSVDDKAKVSMEMVSHLCHTNLIVLTTHYTFIQFTQFLNHLLYRGVVRRNGLFHLTTHLLHLFCNPLSPTLVLGMTHQTSSFGNEIRLEQLLLVTG